MLLFLGYLLFFLLKLKVKLHLGRDGSPDDNLLIADMHGVI